MNGAVLLMCATLIAIDGDSIKCDGVNMRDMGDGVPFVSGYDTPEILKPKCQQELELGRAAKARMSELLNTPGVQVRDSGKRDRYERPLVSVVMPDGRTAGSILIEESLARVWGKGYEADWCQPKTVMTSYPRFNGRYPEVFNSLGMPKPKPTSVIPEPKPIISPSE